MRYAYPCLIERDTEEFAASGREAYVITFRDVPPAISGGWSWPEALEMAQDCLDVALTFYTDDSQPLPTPSPPRDGEVMISTTPTVAAKTGPLHGNEGAGHHGGHSPSNLDLTNQATKKLLNPLYRSHITTVRRALAVVGRELVVEDCAVASQPESVAIGSDG